MDTIKYLINWLIALGIFCAAAYGGIMLIGPFGFVAGVISAGAYASATDLV